MGDDLKEGLISKAEFDDFRESYGRKCEELEQMIENQKKLVKQMFEGGVSATVQLEDWKKSLEIKELDRTCLLYTSLSFDTSFDIEQHNVLNRSIINN